MKRLFRPLLALALLLPAIGQAHDAWIVPSETVLSGNEAWITVDAAAGNDKFFFNHRPLSLDTLQIVSPDGARIKAENLFTGKLRSGFDLQLTESGTYRIAVVRDGVSAQWSVDGKKKRWFGSIDAYATEVPQNAADLNVQERSSRIETFVTKGEPSAIATVNQGIGLVPVTHPNDLFTGEPANFIMTIDGQPAKQASVKIEPEGNRYRDSLDAISLTTDDEGKFEVTWPHAGRYWVGMHATTPSKSLPGTHRRQLTYSATLEVLPQ